MVKKLKIAVWLRVLTHPFLLLLFLSACSSGPAIQESRVELPFWYENPSYPGYIGVTASAMPQKIGGIEGQRRAALLMARAEMAKMKNVQVQSLSETVTTTTNSGVRFSNEDYRRIGSTQALQLYNVVVKDEWIHPETGELFLWLVYPVSP